MTLLHPMPTSAKTTSVTFPST